MSLRDVFSPEIHFAYQIKSRTGSVYGAMKDMLLNGSLIAENSESDYSPRALTQIDFVAEGNTD